MLLAEGITSPSFTKRTKKCWIAVIEDGKKASWWTSPTKVSGPCLWITRLPFLWRRGEWRTKMMLCLWTPLETERGKNNITSGKCKHVVTCQRVTSLSFTKRTKALGRCDREQDKLITFSKYLVPCFKSYWLCSLANKGNKDIQFLSRHFSSYRLVTLH